MSELQDLQALLQELGVEMPSTAFLLGSTFFSLLGLVAWVKGRRAKRRAVVWLGVALMLYPMVVWATAPMFVVGIVLTAATGWAWRRTPTGG
jgi:hypothetical protein